MPPLAEIEGADVRAGMVLLDRSSGVKLVVENVDRRGSTVLLALRSQFAGRSTWQLQADAPVTRWTSTAAARRAQ